jgi:Zn-dependent protease with chaperone function
MAAGMQVSSGTAGMRGPGQLDPTIMEMARHKRELLLFWICALLNIIVIVSLFYQEVSYVVFLVILTIYMLYEIYAMTRARAVRVSEKNFPEVYYKSVEFATKLGLDKVPAVYITQEGGMINAFASAVFGRRYAQLNAEIVEVAYLEHKDFRTVFFVLGHEFAHIYYKHVAPHNILLILFGRLIPVIGPMLSRAREYSCDRLSQYLNQSDCVDGIMLLYTGRHLYKYVDINEYLINAEQEKGLFLWLYNLNASHPIGPKRVAALADPLSRDGELL